MTRRERTDALGERLRKLRAPDEQAAGERSRAVVLAALSGHRSAPRRLADRRLVAAIVAAALAIAGLALTPAGASVRDWIGDAVGVGGDDGRESLRTPPGGGRLLVSSEAGTWAISEAGSRRRIGAYREAGWSPSGLFVVTARGRQLVAAEPDGSVHWALSAPGRVSDPRWAPSGFRIAYRSGDDLRVVAGDGSGDRLLARDAGPIDPVWRPAGAAGPGPAEANALAFVTANGALVAVDVDTGRRLWRADRGVGETSALGWLADGRIVVAGPRAITVLSPAGEVLRREPLAARMRVGGLATSASGNRVALIRTRADRGRRRSELILIRATGTEVVLRRLFSGPGRFSGVAFSPGDEWLLLAWPDADQWLFIRPLEGAKLIERVVAVNGISRQFDPSGSGPPAFPRLEGWCCSAPGPASAR